MRVIPLNIAGSEPITTAEAKEHCYVTGSNWDSYIDTLISVAREYAEGQTWQLLRAGTYKMNFDDFPVGILEVPAYPVKSIDTVSYVATDGTDTTIPPADYETDIESYTSRIKMDSWPIAKDVLNAVTVEFTGGYDESNQRLTIPSKIKQAMLLMIKHWFDNREAVIMSEGHTVDVKEVPQAAKMLLNMESLRRFV